MQTTKYEELPKRSRYYQDIIDLNLIEKGILTKEQALEQFGGTYEDLEKAALSVTLVWNFLPNSRKNHWQIHIPMIEYLSVPHSEAKSAQAAIAGE